VSVFSGLVDLDSPDPLEPIQRSASDPAPPTGLDVRSSDGRWLIGWSGRLDNADEVRRRFRLSDPDAVRSPGPMAAEALATGGVEALGAFIGDFAIVAWDTRERRLWLARDAIGFRPLFYLRAADRLWFSTDMGVLIAGPARQRQCAENAGYLAETLAGLVVTIDETPAEGVRRVLPAEALGFSAGRPDPVRVTLWRPPRR
jgi:asparagine synthase (glutamine-hydrolysing)